MKIEGEVTSGLGKGKEFIALDGYAVQFRNKLGYDPYPGTLNLEVDEPVHEHLEDEESIVIEGWEDGNHSFGAVDCYPVDVESHADPDVVPLHIIVPRRTDHDSSTIEIISPVNLREQFDLSDGSTFGVRIISPDSTPW